MRVGGPALFFIQPETTESLIIGIKALRRADVPYFILGGGSNVVFPDSGFDGAVIATGALNFLENRQTTLRCGAGCKIDAVVRYCLEHRLGGLEAFSGLPGTVGGAVRMNARCYEKEISGVLVSAEYLTQRIENSEEEGRGVCRYIMRKEDWAYKKSPFQEEGAVILGASFAVRPLSDAEAVESAEQAAFFLADRQKKRHFEFPSAGSVFKNNHAFGKPSGMLIDEAGLRGFQIGGAQVAPWHGNSIINTGNATAADIKALSDYVAGAVFTKFAFHLEPEIIFV